MRNIAPALAAIALIAAPVAAVAIANPASDRLSQLSDIPRRAALRAALLDSGMWCKRVEAAALQGPWKNLVMWRAKCDLTDARLDYAVFIGPDGSVQARPCADMAYLKLPVCRPLIRRAR
jgi:hypothetical protein